MTDNLPGKCELCRVNDSLVFLNGIMLVCWDCFKIETNFQDRHQRGYGDNEFAYFDEYPNEDPFEEAE